MFHNTLNKTKNYYKLKKGIKSPFDKSYNSAGWVFMDYRNNKEMNNKNTILNNKILIFILNKEIIKIMKGKILNIIALFSSFLGYLEWGTNKSMFLFHAEYDILSKLFIKPLDVIHPLTILPLLGQFFLFITVGIVNKPDE